jgi:hypothetical protein
VSLTGIAFALLYLGVLGLALWRDPRFGLYTYIAIFYIHPPSRWWGAMLPDLRWSMLAAVVTLIAIWRKPANPARPTWVQTTPGLGLLLLAAWFVIQNLWALDPEQHKEATALFVKFVLLYYLVYRIVDTPKEVERFLLVNFAGCVYLGWLALGADYSGRLEGVGGPGIDEANAFAVQMGSGVISGGILLLTSSGWLRWAAVLGIPFALNGIFLSGSRSGFLSLMIAGPVIWFLKPPAVRGRFYVIAALGLIAIGVLAGQVFWDRIHTLDAVVEQDEAAMDTSALSRFELIKAQMKMAAAYPLGAGHRGTAVLSPAYLDDRFLSEGSAGVGGERRRASHNTFMSLLVEQGIPGALWFVWMWGWTVLTALRVRRATANPQHSLARAVLAGVTAVLIGVLVGGMAVDYLKSELPIWFWALLASLSTHAAAVQQRSPQRAEVGTTSSQYTRI